MPTPVYGILEGGGAKGLAHIAGIAAAERNDLEFIGIAGASAGALIASLVAVGYTASELFDPRNPVANLLTRYGVTPLSLIGVREWEVFKKAGEQALRTGKWGKRTGVLGAWLCGRSAVRVAKEIVATGGYFTTEHVRQHLNEFLRIKLQEHHANAGNTITLPERIRFRDMDPQTVPECCSLKVIVTDISNQKLAIFDGSPEYQDVEVAEAVAASIAIPLVFKPAQIRSYSRAPHTLYADGGMVSNLPIWVFAEEKLNFERTQMPNARVPILAFTLEGDGNVELPVSPGNTVAYVQALARSAIFGGQSVANNFVADLLPIAIPAGLGTTEFDFPLRRALDTYSQAYAVAGGKLGREIRVRPRQIERILKSFHNDISALISPPGGPIEIDHLRISLIKPFGTSSFRIVHAYNMDTDADDRLVFSHLAQGAPSAFNNKAPAFINFTGMLAAASNANMTKCEFALLRRSLHSAICLPIFEDGRTWGQDIADRPKPLGVVSIDSDFDLAHIFQDVNALQALAVMSLALSAALAT